MIFLGVFSFILLLLYCIFWISGIKTFQPYIIMSRGNTAVIRALAILMVVWGHVGASLGVQNIQFIGGVGVALFLICSGYGLFISYQKNVDMYGSKNGLKDYWKKKIVKVVLPFWFVEIVGLLLVGKFNVIIIAKDLLFIQPATAYGWYMQYLMICYVLFWLIIKMKEYGDLSQYATNYLLLGCFVLWFVIESVFLANPNMPFLKARQMLSFPLGVLWGIYSKQISSIYITECEKVNDVYFIWYVCRV